MKLDTRQFVSARWSTHCELPRRRLLWCRSSSLLNFGSEHCRCIYSCTGD